MKWDERSLPSRTCAETTWKRLESFESRRINSIHFTSSTRKRRKMSSLWKDWLILQVRKNNLSLNHQSHTNQQSNSKKRWTRWNTTSSLKSHPPREPKSDHCHLQRSSPRWFSNSNPRSLRNLDTRRISLLQRWTPKLSEQSSESN